MKTTESIQTILDKVTHEGKLIPSGLTNDNYIVKHDNKAYVVRLTRKENRHLFNYDLESRIIDMVAPLNLDVPTLFYDRETGVKITEYIENAKPFELDSLVRATNLIRTLHNAKLECGTRFDLVGVFESFKKDLENPIFDLEPFIHYIHDAKSISRNWTLCHNDIVKGNLLFTSDQSFLIDYEYACDNDPLFDIMSFITENDIQDKNDRMLIYETYFGSKLNQETMERLFTFECAHHVLWCTWAMRMMQVDGRSIYKDIAVLKYQRLLKCIRSTWNS